MSPVIRSAGVEQAAEVHRQMRLAFEEYRALLSEPYPSREDFSITLSKRHEGTPVP